MLIFPLRSYFRELFFHHKSLFCWIVERKWYSKLTIVINQMELGHVHTRHNHQYWVARRKTAGDLCGELKIRVWFRLWTCTQPRISIQVGGGGGASAANSGSSGFFKYQVFHWYAISVTDSAFPLVICLGLVVSSVIKMSIRRMSFEFQVLGPFTGPVTAHIWIGGGGSSSSDGGRTKVSIYEKTSQELSRSLSGCQSTI